jgi:hypothetical protein
LFWTALLFFVANIFLVLLTIFVDSRYVLPTGIFPSSLLALLLFYKFERIAAAANWRADAGAGGSIS